MAKLLDKTKKTVSKKTANTKSKNLAPHKLMLLITIVPREKAEFYEDFVGGHGVNASFTVSARGTAPSEVLSYIGAGDNAKAVIFSVVNQDAEKTILSSLEEKFIKVRNGKGVAITCPLTSTIGVAIYKFLTGKEK